jgi:RNA polymerase sigma-70 factor (ECF subfamily)
MMEAVRPSLETSEADEGLLARVASGDQAAFEKLFLRYQKRLFRYLLGAVRAEAIAEELVCETMTDVWRNARTFQGRSRVSTWIFGIASNKAKTALRRPQRQEADPEVVLRLEDPNPGPADEIARRELAGQVRAALEHLTPEHRQVVELTFMHGFSYQEIAQIAGCPVNTVKTRMFHAKRRLREALGGIFSGRVS